MKKLSWALAVVTLLASGGYVLVYVYRWEWHRAQLVGILFLAALVGMCTAVVLRRLNRLEAATRSHPPTGHRPDPLQRLRAAPMESPTFRWLRPQDLDGAHIFIPVLLGGGVLVSGVAWLVERLAGASARAGVEEELAASLRDIAFPDEPLVPSRAEGLAGPARSGDPAVRLLLGPSAVGRPR
ncbi:hypothetical protein GCM10023328_22430 [Modestobacter marinus]|uniref:H+/Cl- antiporter ClcA n=1 Tax=Modestobacter marinus TaxID=477641 RepID=A0A846LUT1_9ACTN|nr:hypothetical protein [Modestobacter marinus]NIH70122.1 H+/Cl- antiporter ClcA [Modestobacter marinus]GGL84119.1 hypothetical protein GCM10011589_45750 [Modestobacter marinus]